MNEHRIILDGSIRLPFEYAAGTVASAGFTAERAERRLLGSRCEQCDRTLSPARSLCPVCGAEIRELVDVGPSGTVESWTLMPGTGTFLLVRPDGSDTAMLAKLVGGQGQPPRIGARVRAVFDDDGLAGFEVVG